MKTIKIPKGQFKLIFERDELTSTVTDEMLITFIKDGVNKMTNEFTEREFKEPITYNEVYDDTDPNYIRSSQEEI